MTTTPTSGSAGAARTPQVQVRVAAGWVNLAAMNDGQVIRYEELSRAELEAVAAGQPVHDTLEDAEAATRVKPHR